jgi:adenylosuccinate lyase
MLDRMRWVIAGLRVYPERMKANLDMSYGLLNSQTVLTALLGTGGLQREEAYALVQRNAMAAWEEGRPFIELLKSDPEVTEHLDPDEIDRCFDPARYLENTATVFERLEAL